MVKVNFALVVLVAIFLVPISHHFISFVISAGLTSSGEISDLFSKLSSWFQREECPDSWEEAKYIFMEEMNALEAKFPSQTKETWIQLTATISKTLQNVDPAHPAVITALIPPSVHLQFITCFFRKIGLALNKAVAVGQMKQEADKSSVNPHKFISPESFNGKSITEIRNEIERYLNSDGKSLIVVDVDKFKNEQHLLMFHGICDNYHAVDVRATIIFPVVVPTEIYNIYKSKWRHVNGGEISNKVLSTAWKDVVRNNVGPALIARIADAVVLIDDGDTCSEEFSDISDKSKFNSSIITNCEIIIKKLETKVVELQKKVEILETRQPLNSSDNECSKRLDDLVLSTEKQMKVMGEEIISLRDQLQKLESFQSNKPDPIQFADSNINDTNIESPPVDSQETLQSISKDIPNGSDNLTVGNSSNSTIRLTNDTKPVPTVEDLKGTLTNNASSPKNATKNENPSPSVKAPTPNSDAAEGKLDTKERISESDILKPLTGANDKRNGGKLKNIKNSSTVVPKEQSPSIKNANETPVNKNIKHASSQKASANKQQPNEPTKMGKSKNKEKKNGRKDSSVDKKSGGKNSKGGDNRSNRQGKHWKSRR